MNTDELNSEIRYAVANPKTVNMPALLELANRVVSMLLMIDERRTIGIHFPPSLNEDALRAAVAGMPQIRERDDANGSVSAKKPDGWSPIHNIIPPESPKPLADKRAERRDLLKLAGGSVLGIIGLEQSAYTLRAGDGGVSLRQHAANAISYAMGRLIDTGEHGVGDAVVLLKQIQDELLADRGNMESMINADRAHRRARFDDHADALSYGLRFVVDHERVAQLEREIESSRGLHPKLAELMSKPVDIQRARSLALSYLAGGDSPPLHESTTSTLARAVRDLTEEPLKYGETIDIARSEAADWFAAGTEWTCDQIPNADRRTIRGRRETTFAHQWGQHLAKVGVARYENEPSRELARDWYWCGARNGPAQVESKFSELWEQWRAAHKRWRKMPPSADAKETDARELVEKLLEPMRKQVAELGARLDEELRQRAPVPHDELDIKVGFVSKVVDRGAWMATVERARERLKLAATLYASERNQPDKKPNPLELKLQELIEVAFALALAVLRQMQRVPDPQRALTFADRHAAEGYIEAIDTIERFRKRAEEGSKQ